MTFHSLRPLLPSLGVLLGLAVGCSSAPEVVPEAMPESAPMAAMEAAPEEMKATTPEEKLAAALTHAGRSEAESARDTYRHPAETLAVFGVQPDHTVFELWSGGGWYTHVLAPYLVEDGKLHVTIYPADSEKEYRRTMNTNMSNYLETQGYKDKVNAIEINADNLDFGIKGQADVVLTFRNIHNWVKGGYDKAVYEQAFTALKPGGVFGVVEHRGPEGMTREQSAKSGYMDQAQVIKDIEAIGFKFVESSEINANPKDTKDHVKGVWTLPPSLRLGDQDKEKYVEIGESDRMTLKFIKPASP